MSGTVLPFPSLVSLEIECRESGRVDEAMAISRDVERAAASLRVFEDRVAVGASR